MLHLLQHIYNNLTSLNHILSKFGGLHPFDEVGKCCTEVVVTGTACHLSLQCSSPMIRFLFS
jgi:hypothetical protein